MDEDQINDGQAAVTAEPVLNSTAGLSSDDLSARPTLDGGSAAVVAGDGGVDATAAPADPNAAATVAEPSQPTIRDAAAYYGIDLSNYQDDGQAFAALVQMAQRAREQNYYAQLGQQIAPHYQQVQQYLQQQTAASQKPADRKPWEAPEFDDRWLALVDRDESTGRYVAKPGINPAFADKVNAFAEHVEGFTQKLTRNPREALSGLIEEVAGQLLESRFGQVQAQQEAQQIIASNESWIYQTDANGRRLTSHDGRYVPTPLGARYYTHLQTLQGAGVKDARQLDTLAKQMLQSDIYAQHYGQQQTAAQAATPQARAAVARPQVNVGQAVPPARRAVVPGATEPAAEGLTLAEQLRRAMAEEGVTDADFQSING